MRSLPDRIVALDGSQKVVRVYTRQSPDNPRMNERDYDQLVIRHKDVIADTLRTAGLIQRDSDLRVLGPQVEGIDVLFAEVRQGGDEEFRRLVIVEDKLLKNPEARRQVLAQAWNTLRGSTVISSSTTSSTRWTTFRGAGRR